MRCLVHTLLWLATKIFEWTFWPIKQFRKLRKPKCCPPIRDDLLLIPAANLAAQIRNRDLSSEAIVAAYVKRVKEVNPVLNAVVEDRFAAAVEDAKRVDLFLAETELSKDELEEKYPLLGVPVTVKESIALEGFSFNAGMTGPRRRNAGEDAGAVKRVKDAGAVVLLKSNTPEWCLNWETVNKYTGRTVNPYDSRKTCGGSSGGEAALLAAAASIIGVGSDVGGSLRLPPHFCGIFGHKPSPGVVSNTGNIPSSTSTDDWNFVFSTGPMTRYAVDLPLLLGVMVEPEQRSKLKLRKIVGPKHHLKKFVKLHESFQIDPKRIKIYYMEHDGGSLLTHFVQRDIVKAMRKVVNYMKVEGYTVKKANFKEMSDSIDLAFLPLLNIKGVNTVFDDGNRNVFVEILKTMVCNSSVQPTSILFKVISYLATSLTSKERLDNIETEVTSLRESFQGMLKDDGVFFYPTFPSVAHFHDEVYSKTCDTSYMAIFNVLGFPVTICPIGFNTEGLPIGIQIVGNFHMDHLCISIAKALENAFGGWVPPPSYNRKEGA